jgi:hypothetical protein
MQTYGVEYLTRADSVVIDVAGGKGELAWELINLTGVHDCLVIDPRPLNLELVKSKWDKGLFEPKRTGPIFSKWYPACEEGCKSRESKPPSHLRCCFSAHDFLEFLHSSANASSDEWLRREISKSKDIVWTTKGLQHEDGSNYSEDAEPQTHLDVTNGTLIDYSTVIEEPSDLKEKLQKCHLIIGLHPDQAAGSIVQFAAARKIPWCIVPCCVYSQCFTKRKLKDGTHVRTYDQLVDWLCEQDPRARVALLDFEGKNKVVYTPCH